VGSCAGPCRAPLPDSHGSVNWRRLLRVLVDGSFRLVAPQRCCPIRERNCSRGTCGGLRAAEIFPSSRWLENGGPEATATVFRTIAWKSPYPILNQWVRFSFHPNIQMKFQVGLAPATLPHSRTKLPEPWKPEAQARGWGTPRIPPAWLLAAPQAPSSPHCAALQPLAALQASSRFALLADLQVRVPNEASA